AGSDFLARIEPVLAELDEAEHAARGTGELRGILRIGLGTNFAVREIIPRLAAFMSRHSALQIDLMMSDQRQDLVAEGVDLAFRFGALPDSTATARRVLSWPRVLAAARAYLDKAGVPGTPADLPQHAIILGPGSLGGHWSFRKDDGATSFQVEGRLIVRASEGAIAAAVAGLGILMAPLVACRRDVDMRTRSRSAESWRHHAIRQGRSEGRFTTPQLTLRLRRSKVGCGARPVPAAKAERPLSVQSSDLRGGTRGNGRDTPIPDPSRPQPGTGRFDPKATFMTTPADGRVTH